MKHHNMARTNWMDKHILLSHIVSIYTLLAHDDCFNCFVTGSNLSSISLFWYCYILSAFIFVQTWVLLLFLFLKRVHWFDSVLLFISVCTFRLVDVCSVSPFLFLVSWWFLLSGGSFLLSTAGLVYLFSSSLTETS